MADTTIVVSSVASNVLPQPLSEPPVTMVRAPLTPPLQSETHSDSTAYGQQFF